MSISLRRKRHPALALTVVLAAACGESGTPVGEGAAAPVAFEPLQLRAVAPPPGLTLVRDSASYDALFGDLAPVELVDLDARWMLHVASAPRATTGHETTVNEVLRVARGLGAFHLVVRVLEEAPGPACFVFPSAVALVPQATIAIAPQPDVVEVELVTESWVLDCTEPCPAAGGRCRSSPLDATFAASCEGELSQVTLELPCASITQSCCSPRALAEEYCARSAGDACATDADCRVGGCGGELCYNPQISGHFTTCDCTRPEAVACGCVDGGCGWYE